MKEFIIVSLLYVIFAIIFTYPLILLMNTHVPTGLYSHYDPYLNIWVLAWGLHIIFFEPLEFYNAPIFFPESGTLTYSEHMLGNLIISLPAGIVTRNPVLQYNFCLLMVLVLTGLGMYLLYKHISGSRLPAFLSGIFFTFSMLKFRYISLLQIQSLHWVPYALLFFIKFVKNKDHKNLLLFLIFTFLSGITSIYITLMFGIYITSFFFILLLYYGLKYFDRNFFLRFLPLLFVTIFLILIIHIPYLRTFMSGLYTSYPQRDEEVLSKSASISSYLTIPAHSWLWSRVFSVDVSWTGLSPGVFMILLGLVGVFYVLRERKDPESIPFFSIIFTGIISFLLSFGSKTFLYQFLTIIIPVMKGIRIPDRFSLFFLLTLSLFAGKGIEGLRGKKILSFMIIILFVLENIHIPLRMKQVQEVLDPKPVYLWLKDQQVDGGILEIPMFDEPEKLWLEVEYTINTVHHWKKIVNGYSGYIPDSFLKIREAVFKGFPKKDCLLLLKKYGVKLIILHTQYFDRALWGELKKYIDESPLIPVAEFGYDKVYRIPDEVE